MKRTLSVRINNFALQQNLYIIDKDGAVENLKVSTMERLEDSIVAAITEFDIEKIELRGNQKFAQKYVKGLQNKFDISKLEIKIIA